MAAIVGVGPGLGAAVAKRFARERYAVALMSRQAETSETFLDIQRDIERGGGVARSFSVDASDPTSVASAFARVREELGRVDVLIYNAGAFRMGLVTEISPDDFEASWRANCLGGFLVAREVVPSMVDKTHGTVIFTGATASLRGSARFSCLAVGKFGLRALAQSLAREVGALGVHVAHVVIDGQIDTPRLRAMSPDRDARTLLAPDDIAETYWHLHSQKPTTWTLELDLRPAAEKF